MTAGQKRRLELPTSGQRYSTICSPRNRQRAVALIDCFIESEQDMADEDYLALLESLRAYLQSAA
jgi:hypothetical protein